MDLPKRKQIRLQKYDYSKNGAYFVTICTANRNETLSCIRRGDPCGRPNVELTTLGEIAANTFDIISQSYPVNIDKYVVMPNHIHIIMIITQERATARVAPTLGDVIGAYKSIVATQWLKICKEKDQIMGPIWQQNYYEHIIRNEKSYQEIWQYIDDNPAQWSEDEYFKGTPLDCPHTEIK